MTDDTPTKETLRHEALRHRDRIDPGSEDPEQAALLFFENIKPEPGQAISLYWPKGREIDSRPIIEMALQRGFTCALPIVRKGEKELGFAAWDESIPLTAGPHDVQQPVIDGRTKWVEPDIVIVPLLAFDRRGYRLGYGGGYYDATLRALRGRKDVLAVGLAWAQQAVLFSLPTETHDERMDWIITPLQAHSYGGRAA